MCSTVFKHKILILISIQNQNKIQMFEAISAITFPTFKQNQNSCCVKQYIQNQKLFKNMFENTIILKGKEKQSKNTKFQTSIS